MYDMVLNYLKDNSIIYDFQLIYDTDSKLHFDFYAYGLAKELQLLANVNDKMIPAYGMVKISKEKYQKALDKIDLICDDYNLLIIEVENMKNAIKRLIGANILLEESLNNEKDMFESLKLCFNSVIDVMAYRMISEKASEMLAECVNIEHISELGVPSYLLILKQNKEKIKNNDDIIMFIKEYGYLSSFNIAPTLYESEKYLSTLNKGCGGVIPMHISYDDSYCKSDMDKIVYGLSWYSELRHIYQLRTLRNFRWYFEKKRFDIHKTGVGELFGL